MSIHFKTFTIISSLFFTTSIYVLELYVGYCMYNNDSTNIKKVIDIDK